MRNLEQFGTAAPAAAQLANNVAGVIGTTANVALGAAQIGVIAYVVHEVGAVSICEAQGIHRDDITGKDIAGAYGWMGIGFIIWALLVPIIGWTFTQGENSAAAGAVLLFALIIGTAITAMVKTGRCSSHYYSK